MLLGACAAQEQLATKDAIALHVQLWNGEPGDLQKALLNAIQGDPSIPIEDERWPIAKKEYPDYFQDQLAQAYWSAEPTYKKREDIVEQAKEAGYGEDMIHYITGKGPGAFRGQRFPGEDMQPLRDIMDRYDDAMEVLRDYWKIGEDYVGMMSTAEQKRKWMYWLDANSGERDRMELDFITTKLVGHDMTWSAFFQFFSDMRQQDKRLHRMNNHDVDVALMAPWAM